MMEGDNIAYTTLVLFEFFRSFAYYGVQVMQFFLFYTEVRWPLLDSIAMVHLYGLLFYLSAMVGLYFSNERKPIFVNIFSIVAIIGNCLIFTCVLVHDVARDWDYLQMFMEATLILGSFLRAVGAGLARELPLRIGEDMIATAEDPRKIRSRLYLLLFYTFSAGVGLAVLLLPLLRMNVVCAAMNMCWPLPIGIATAVLVVGIIVFNGGAFNYARAEPIPVEIRKISQCIFSGDAYREADFRYGDYEDEFVMEAAHASKVAILFIPLSLFWALFEQMWTRWPYQGLRMNGLVNNTVPLEPDSMFLVVPMVNMFVQPFLQFIIFPLLIHVVFCGTPKGRIVFGAFLALIAFGMACAVETFVHDEMEHANMTRSPGTAQLVFLNPSICGMNFTASGLPPSHNQISLAPHSVTFVRDIPCSSKIPFKIKDYRGAGQFWEWTSVDQRCQLWQYPFDRTYHIYKDAVTGLFGSVLITNLYKKVPPMAIVKQPYVEEMMFRDHIKGGLQVPQLGYAYKLDVNREAPFRTCHEITQYDPLRLSSVVRHFLSYKHTIHYEPIPSGKYFPDFCSRSILGTKHVVLKKGGVYLFMLIQKSDDAVYGGVTEIEKPFKHALTWQIPQYATMALAQLLCPNLALNYSYQQVAPSMGPWLLFIWLFMAAFGNFIVFIEALSGVFKNQVHAYYFYLALMLFGLIMMIVCCWSYEHIVPEEMEEEEEEE